MTYIEFFDKEASENICACLTQTPDRVIFVGDNIRLMEKYIERYHTIFTERGKNIKFIPQTVNKNNLQSIIDSLSKIVENYEDCCFDLTGGEDLYLVAMGIVYERYRDKNIQMHRFNIRNNTVIDCDQDGHTIEDNAIGLTIEENIRIYGGDIVYDNVKKQTTFHWNMTEEFQEDIEIMWEICRKDVRLWNTQIGVFAAAEEFRDPSLSELTTVAPVSCTTDRLKKMNGKFITIRHIFEALKKAGLLTSFQCTDETISISYKNSQVKQCLTKAGQALEMKIYKAVINAREKDGTLIYNDVMNGVYIDWDGEIHTEQNEYDTENEIDVMMMHGLVPVFVSCKNGSVSMEELYKLNTVANRFGGKYAKKVLIATALENSEKPDFAKYFRNRAKDMNIRLVEEVQYKNDVELNRIVRTFWSN